MFGKKRPVLTKTYCDRMENARRAIEVYSGEQTRWIQADFNTEKFSVRIGRTDFEIMILFPREDLVQFNYGHGWVIANIEEDEVIKVCHEQEPDRHPTHRFPMQWVGKSASERRQEPLFLREAEYCAKVRNLTLDEYLKQ